MTKVPTYDVVSEYTPNNDGQICVSPGWVIAVIRLGNPLSYSRKDSKSVGDIVSGALQRREKPLIITRDALQVSITRSRASHTKSLTATLKSADVNYLSANAILPGDWILAWMHNNETDTKQIVEKINRGETCNRALDGLKFVGRVHSIRKRLSVSAMGVKTMYYALQAVGFRELDTEFYYDVHLAASVARGGYRDIALFMKQLGLDWTQFVAGLANTAGRVRDNMAELVPALLDVVVGKGASGNVNKPLKDAYSGKGVSKDKMVLSGPQASITVPDMEESPYAYLVPVAVAKYLGKETKSKDQAFSYADILHLLIGVQKYQASQEGDPGFGFWPVLKDSSTSSRSFCREPLKGSYLPQAENFINVPLWTMLEQFLNPAINEMYTALKLGPDGLVRPTLVVRQIPFSTNILPETPERPLSRFLEQPRWRIDPIMVKDADLGRSDATHKNMVKLSGNPVVFSGGGIVEPGRQLVLHPPVFDTVDIARSGIRTHCQIINCTTSDIVTGGRLRKWTEAVADWTIGSQFTLNGVITTCGVQSPVAEGDNLEFDGIVYYIEAITDTCMIHPNGVKVFNTSFTLSNGMPAEQSDSKEFPTYPGFSVFTGNDGLVGDDGESLAREEIDGDDSVATNNDPGMSRD